jgi:hypothetical protein
MSKPADDEDDAIRPLPDRLVSELTAERTLALRDALANAPDAAFLALLHALVPVGVPVARAAPAACRSASPSRGSATRLRTCARASGAPVDPGTGMSSGRHRLPR